MKDFRERKLDSNLGLGYIFEKISKQNHQNSDSVPLLVKRKWIKFSSFNKTKVYVSKLLNEIDHMDTKLQT